MSKPGTHELIVSNLSDDYICDLKSENQRYDITLAQDFVISVLPNGIKTWAYIYDFQGRNRRRTLGVFPDMTFEEAKIALKKTRQVMIRMDEPTVPPDDLGTRPAVLGGGHYVPKSNPRKTSKLKLFFGTLALLTVLGIAAYFWQSSRSPQVTPANSAKFDPTQPFATKPKKPKTTPTTAPPDAANQTQESNSGSTTSIEAPTPDKTKVTTPPSPEKRNTPTPAKATRAATPTPVKPVKKIVTTGKATAFGGNVSRSVLTSRVDKLEPTDVIGPEISYKESGYTRVFYFTELREFSDGAVLHRWERNGEMEEEVLLNVKKSWRWRTFSNKDIPSGLTGEWKVMTIDATGTVLDSKTFTYGY